MTKQDPKIVLKEDTKKELAKLGNKDDTYNTIVKKLIKIAKEIKNNVK
jgi:hypothetical protein